MVRVISEYCTLSQFIKKHGITQADFDTSMVWYARHPDVLTKVYEKGEPTAEKSRGMALITLIALRDNKPKESLPGDSIDVWIWQHVYELTGMPLDNKIAFIRCLLILTLRIEIL